MLCPSCKSQIPDDGRFCPKCGEEINPKQFSIGSKQTLGSRRDSVGPGETVSGEESLGEKPTVTEGVRRKIGLTGRYEIIEELGRGGAGIVYKAKDKELGRIVAIKRLLAKDKSAERAIQRFLREARSIASLSHPGVVNIYDIGEDEEGKFISMEYVDGGSLKDKISSEGKVEFSTALDIVQQVSKALSQAHKRGLIHRDIKPGNILLTQEGIAKLGDFGLAMGMDEASFTRTGAMLGTPDYMSPEQRIDSKNVSKRADIYSLGATLYEMVTGDSPRVIHSEKIPDKLREPILKSLESNPEKRYASVEEFISSLPQPEEVVAPVKRLEIGCPQCGRESPADVKFCIYCGADLFEKCPKCGRDNRVGTRHCGSCGVNIEQFKQIQNHHLSKAKEFCSTGNFSQALEELNKVLELNPSHDEAMKLQKEVSNTTEYQKYYAEGERCFALEKWEEANLAYSEALKYRLDEAELEVKIEKCRQKIPLIIEGIEMIYIPRGEFMMGSPSSEEGRRSDEGPVHKVKITKGFYLGKYAVTRAQYQVVMPEDPATLGFILKSDLPQTEVTRYNAVEFCRRLSKKTSKEFRLPTEAEWEYACRAGTTTAFHYGDSISPKEAALCPSRQMLVFVRKFTSVGSFKPNAWGLYDMHGNVWEWCSDWYDVDYYKKSSYKDPKGPSSGDRRILRGGGGSNYAKHCRSACRYSFNPKNKGVEVGFRCALTP